MMMVAMFFPLRLGWQRGGLSALNVFLQLRKRALRLGQIAGRKRLAERSEIVRDGVVIVAGRGDRSWRGLRLKRLPQRREGRLRSRQVAALQRACQLRVVLLNLLSGILCGGLDVALQL